MKKTDQLPAIFVEGLTKTYGKQTAIDNISFTVNKGEVIGFIGPNGAGKSTTMKIITHTWRLTVAGL
jgi:ABC-2 type transport system ATP-binding protein